MSAVTKPVLRGHIQRRGLKSIIGALTFGALSGGLYYLLVSVRRTEKYNEFLKTYDPVAHYEELAQKGYLQSAKLINSKPDQ